LDPFYINVPKVTSTVVMTKTATIDTKVKAAAAA
jgi:hypothetical protein